MPLHKSTVQQEQLRQAGKHLAAVFAEIKKNLRPGITTIFIDQLAFATMTALGTRPSFLHYQGYANSTCVSINDEVIHGIPSDKIIKEGDIVTVDAGLWYNNVCVDAATTYCIGTPNNDVKRLLTATKEALAAGVRQVQPGNRVGMISAAIERVAKRNQLGIVRNYTGHGVGTAVHEEPSIPNYGKASDGIKLEEGMVLAIEPMLTLGGSEVITLPDGWTVVTNDGSLSAQFENTVLVTATGHEILV